MTIGPLSKKAALVFAKGCDAGRTEFRNDYAGSQHILLGILLHGDCLAARVLARFRVTSDGVRKLMPVGRRDPDKPPRHKAHITKELKAAIATAAHMPTPEYLLVGILSEGQTTVPDMLRQLGVDPDVLRRGLVELLTSAHRPASTVAVLP